MAQTTLSLFFTILLLNWHYHTPDKPMHELFNKCIIIPLATALRMRNELDEHFPLSKTSRDYEQLDNDPPDTSTDRNVRENRTILSDEVLDHLRYLISIVREKERRERNAQHWHNLGKVIDRLLMYLFVFATVMELICFFAIITYDH